MKERWYNFIMFNFIRRPGWHCAQLSSRERKSFDHFSLWIASPVSGKVLSLFSCLKFKICNLFVLFKSSIRSTAKSFFAVFVLQDCFKSAVSQFCVVSRKMIRSWKLRNIKLEEWSRVVSFKNITNQTRWIFIHVCVVFTWRLAGVARLRADSWVVNLFWYLK